MPEHRWEDELSRRIADEEELWIGLRKVEASAGFEVWADGTPVGFTNFSTRHGEPDRAGEHYVAMWVDWGGCGQSSSGNDLDRESNACGLGRHYTASSSCPPPPAQQRRPGW